MTERHTLLHRLVDGVMLCVHADEPPSHEDWDDFVRARDGHGPGARGLLVIAPPKATIDASQRWNVRTFLKMTGARLAVVTESRVVRGLVTAVAWFNVRVAPFAPDEIAGALSFLGLGADRHDEARKVLRELALELHVASYVR